MNKLAAALVVSLFPFSAAHSHGDAVDALLNAVTRARVVDLSHTWTKTSPVASVNPPYDFHLVATHANTRGMQSRVAGIQRYQPLSNLIPVESDRPIRAVAVTH